MTSTKRKVCTRCEYPLSTCLCVQIQTIVNPIHILVLQDPSEVKHHKNTVRLLKLALNNITVQIADSTLQPISMINNDNAVVLYPSADAFCMEDLIENLPKTSNGLIESMCNDCDVGTKTDRFLSPSLSKTIINFGNIKHLILLDGSWSKTHKIWSTQKWLQDIPQMTFAELPDSQYRIRKANRKNSLSTLEACAHVLKKLYKVNVTPLYNLLNALQDDWDAHKKAASSNNS